MEEKGYKIIERNFRCRTGEIDIIAMDGRYLCFIEVKYRNSTVNGFPEEAVTKNKQHIIYRVAMFYLKKNGIGFESPCRFDVVSILDEKITLYKNAFGSM